MIRSSATPGDEVLAVLHSVKCNCDVPKAPVSPLLPLVVRFRIAVSGSLLTDQNGRQKATRAE